MNQQKSVQAMITAQRDRLREQRESLPRQRALLLAERQRASELVKTRSGMRSGALLRRDCDDKAAMLAAIESGVQERRFEERVLPFLRGHDTLSSKRIATSRRKLPGARKRRRIDGVPAWTEQTSTTATIVREYMAEFEGVPSAPIVHASEVCAVCGGKLMLLERKGTLCCEDCGNSIQHIDMTSCINVQSADIEFVSQSYKRSNHFLEWLNQLQAKESTQVGDDVLRATMRHIYDKGIRDCRQISVSVVRDALKTLRLRSMYEHVCQITCRITGAAPPRLQPHIEEQLRLMFVAVQEPFDRVKGTRKNFLSYSYTLQQFMHLLGVSIVQMERMAFTLLKGRDKLDRQNTIYQRVCEQPDLNWEFRPIVH